MYLLVRVCGKRYTRSETPSRGLNLLKSPAKYNGMKSHWRIIDAFSSKGTKALILKQMARAATKMGNLFANQEQGTRSRKEGKMKDSLL